MNLKFDRLRNNTFNQWLIIHVRYILGFAFLPSGMTKLLGERFTRISTDHPIGYFFEGLYQTGFYWNFLGFAQILAGVILITQRFATLGALVFFSILVNIWLITISLHFKGTWFITSLMMLANIILLIWDQHKFRSILTPQNSFVFKNYPEPHKDWVFAGILYCVVFFIFYFGSDLKFIPQRVSFLFIILSYFFIAVISNFRGFKRSKAAKILKPNQF